MLLEEEVDNGNLIGARASLNARFDAVATTATTATNFMPIGTTMQQPPSTNVQKSKILASSIKANPHRPNEGSNLQTNSYNSLNLNKIKQQQLQ